MLVINAVYIDGFYMSCRCSNDLKLRGTGRTFSISKSLWYYFRLLSAWFLEYHRKASSGNVSLFKKGLITCNLLLIYFTKCYLWKWFKFCLIFFFLRSRKTPANLEKIMKIQIKFIFLWTYFICNSSSQLNLARNLQ